MARARRNEGGPKIGRGVNLSPDDIRRGDAAFTDWHWSNRPTEIVEWDDPDMPHMLIECGKLIRLHLRIPQTGVKKKHPLRQKDTMIEFSRSIASNCHVAYDPDHPHQRLYLLIDDTALPVLKRRFWDENNFEPMRLGAVAALIGGHHGNPRDYPDVSVRPIGVCTNIIYQSAKKGDEDQFGRGSFYTHAVGEISHVYPALCCDTTGRLWLAGGNGESLTAGLTD